MKLLAVSQPIRFVWQQMKNFRDLQIWNRSHGLILEIYRLTQDTYEKTNAELAEIKRMLNAFIQKLIN